MNGIDFRNRRKRIGLTQQGLALALGCSRQHIATIEDAVSVPRVYALAMRYLYQQKLAEYADA